MPDLETNLNEADLASCDREPIQIPGSIQSHGVLLVLADPSLTIEQATVNTDEFLGIKPEAVLGANLEYLFDTQGAASLRRYLARDGFVDGPFYVQSIQTAVGSRCFHLIGHRHAGKLILEIERAAESGSLSFEYFHPLVSTLVSRLRAASSTPAIAQLAANEVRRLTGFDRVLLYKFGADWSGQVLAESRDPAMPSFLHLHFPASDIPKQARALYEKNRLRLIADVNSAPVPLVPQLNPGTGQPLDLSFSVLRSVSPVHIEYLRNMGVGSSMSISLLSDQGKLWGLIACHHRKPLEIPLEVRTACDLLGQTVSTQLEMAEQRAQFERRIRLSSIATRLVGFMAGENDFLEGLTKHPADFLQFANAEGAATVSGGRCVRVGECPPESEVLRLAEWLSARKRQDVFATDVLSTLVEHGEVFRELASGLLAIPVSRLHRSYVLWFRPEVIRTVEWSGDPRKPVEQRAGQPDRLHPRHSFEVWKETVRGCSVPWQSTEIEAASDLRSAITEIVLRKAEELAEISLELQRSNKELEAFSYSVSHDLRAPFRHILGYSDMLRDSVSSKLDPTEQRYLDVIVRSAEYAGKLVENLLSFAKLGRTRISLRRTDMGKILSEALGDIQSEADGRTIDWQIGPMPEVAVDPFLLRLVWQNLVQNAVKYTRHKERAVIQIGATDNEIEAIFFVKDNGAGFDQAYDDKLFGVFQRLHRREEFEGTGIGLATVRRIIVRHGGRTWAQGEIGKGATFFFSVPHKTAEGGESKAGA